jgi:hypothetical protein
MATVNDLVLVHIDNKPGFYARIEAIVPDVKPGWWQVRLLVLTMPLQVFTWILDESQVNGAPYTMGGTPVRLEKVVAPASPGQETLAVVPTPAGAGRARKKDSGAKVVSLAERKKKD